MRFRWLDRGTFGLHGSALGFPRGFKIFAREAPYRTALVYYDVRAQPQPAEIPVLEYTQVQDTDLVLKIGAIAGAGPMGVVQPDGRCHRTQVLVFGACSCVRTWSLAALSLKPKRRTAFVYWSVRDVQTQAKRQMAGAL